jgi:hypothetical protein
MKYAIQVVITTDEGQTETRDIACLEREDLTPTTLGLTLAEGKAILKGLQEVVVQQQMTAYLETQRPCGHCGHVQRSKGYHATQVRTVFGTIPVHSLRLYQCPCQSDVARTFSPLAVLLPEPITPKLLFLETKWAALVSYGVTAQLLHDVLPIDDALAPCTIREHVFKVAERLERALVSGILWHNSSTGEIQLWFMDGHRLTSRATVFGEDGRPTFIGPPWSIVGTGMVDPRPIGPTGLRVTNVADGTISVSWIDQSDNENGFLIRFLGKNVVSNEHTGTKSVGRDAVSASLTGLRSNYEYTIRVVAFNAFGESRSSNEVRARTPSIPETIRVPLHRQIIVQGFVPYVGTFPLPIGSVPPGRLLQMRVPQSGLQVDMAVSFVKPGHSTTECGNPNAVVVIREGETASPAQMTAIFGVPQPKYSSPNPINFVACNIGPAGQIPDIVEIEITIKED